MERFDALGRHIPVSQVVSDGSGHRFVEQTIVVLTDRPRHRSEEGLFILGASFDDFFAGLLDFDAGSFGQNLHRFEELDRLTSHHEVKYVSAKVANPADPALSNLIDLKGRAAVIVPRAMSHKVGTLTP